MELEHYKPHTDDYDLYMNSCLKEMRKGNIKFYFRLVRTSQKFNLSLDELYTMWFNCVHAMTTKQFFKLFNTDEKFRNTITNRILKNKDE